MIEIIKTRPKSKITRRKKMMKMLIMMALRKLPMKPKT
jgi:hypothetical protein